MDSLLWPLDSGSTGWVDSSPESLILSLLLAFVLGQGIAWMYSWTHSGLSYSRTFTQSLLLMTMIVTLVMTIIGNSIVTAFGLLGALALIRFRNVLKDTRDTVFVFMSLVVGMAVGTQRFVLAIAGTAALLLVITYVNYTSFGGHGHFDGYLTLQVALPSGESDGAVSLLHRFCRTSKRISVRETGRGHESEHIYRIGLRDRRRSRELVDELRKVPGISNASLLIRDEMSEV